MYYGHEALPDDVREDFLRASPFELRLISRCRSSVINHHYARRSRRGGYAPEECSQGFVRGNVGIFPQEPTHLRSVLPPAIDDVRDTVCILFTGGSLRPTAETLRRFRPVLVLRGRVERTIKFLVAHNEWYLSDGVQRDWTILLTVVQTNLVILVTCGRCKSTTCLMAKQKRLIGNRYKKVL